MTRAHAPPNILRVLPWLAAVAFFMEALDTTILNTALPTMTAALHVVPLSMKAVLTSYTLSLAVFIPLSGWVADRFGTRVVFSSAIGLFTLGSLLCGLSSNIVGEADASMASTIASTLQQMSVSFGVASASLTTALFIPNRFHSEPQQMIQGIHRAFLVLGGLTILSAAIFRGLRPGDGDNVSRHGVAPAVSSAVTATEKVS